MYVLLVYALISYSPVVDINKHFIKILHMHVTVSVAVYNDAMTYS